MEAAIKDAPRRPDTETVQLYASDVNPVLKRADIDASAVPSMHHPAAWARIAPIRSKDRQSDYAAKCQNFVRETIIPDACVAITVGCLQEMIDDDICSESDAIIVLLMTDNLDEIAIVQSFEGVPVRKLHGCFRECGMSAINPMQVREELATVGPGSSISLEESGAKAATLGAVLRLTFPDGAQQDFGLTAGHAFGQVGTRESVFQPSRFDRQPAGGWHPIGSYDSRFLALDKLEPTLQPHRHDDQECSFYRDWTLFPLHRQTRTTSVIDERSILRRTGKRYSLALPETTTTEGQNFGFDTKKLGRTTNMTAGRPVGKAWVYRVAQSRTVSISETYKAGGLEGILVMPLDEVLFQPGDSGALAYTITDTGAVVQGLLYGIVEVRSQLTGRHCDHGVYQPISCIVQGIKEMTACVTVQAVPERASCCGCGSCCTIA